MTERRRGTSLIGMIGAMFITGIVLSSGASLYHAAVRQADAATAQARMRTLAREITARLREDVRSGSGVRVAADGAGLTLARSDPNGRLAVSYRWSDGHLVREARQGAELRERDTYSEPLTQAAFVPEQGGVRAALKFERAVARRTVHYETECFAAPRSGR
jgi:hypothetical protein